MPSVDEIKAMLERLEIVDRSVVSRFEHADGYNYANDHTPMSVRDAVERVEPFFQMGTITEHGDHIEVAWSQHSAGELVVYRLGQDSYFVHGWLEVG